MFWVFRDHFHIAHGGSAIESCGTSLQTLAGILFPSYDKFRSTERPLVFIGFEFADLHVIPLVVPKVQ